MPDSTELAGEIVAADVPRRDDDAATEERGEPSERGKRPAAMSATTAARLSVRCSSRSSALAAGASVIGPQLRPAGGLQP